MLACKSRRTGFSREDGISSEEDLVSVPTPSRLKPVLRDYERPADAHGRSIHRNAMLRQKAYKRLFIQHLQTQLVGLGQL